MHNLCTCIIYIEKNWPHKSSHFLCKRRETTEIDTALNLLYEAIQLFSNWVLNDKFTRSNQLLIVMSRPSYRLSDFWIGLVLRSYISCTFTTETLKKKYNKTKEQSETKQKLILVICLPEDDGCHSFLGVINAIYILLINSSWHDVAIKLFDYGKKEISKKN